MSTAPRLLGAGIALGLAAGLLSGAALAQPRPAAATTPSTAPGLAATAGAPAPALGARSAAGVSYAGAEGAGGTSNPGAGMAGRPAGCRVGICRVGGPRDRVSVRRWRSGTRTGPHDRGHRRGPGGHRDLGGEPGRRPANRARGRPRRRESAGRCDRVRHRSHHHGRPVGQRVRGAVLRRRADAGHGELVGGQFLGPGWRHLARNGRSAGCPGSRTRLSGEPQRDGDRRLSGRLTGIPRPPAASVIRPSPPTAGRGWPR